MTALRRSTSLVGVLFAACMLAAMFLDNTPDDNKPGQWAGYYAKDGNQIRTVISTYLWVLAGIALLGFLLVIRERMNGRMPAFSFIAGAFAAAAMCIGGGILGAVGGTALFADGPNPSGEVALFVTSIAYPVILVSSMLPFAACTLSLGVSVIRTHSLPVWIGWFAVVVGILLLGAVIWLPLFAAVLFGLVVGIALAVRPAEGVTYVAPAPA